MMEPKGVRPAKGMVAGNKYADTLAIGVDVGATKVAAALVAGDGETLLARQRPTAPERGWEAVLDDVAALVGALLAEAPAEPLGVGVGTPGRVDARQGVVRDAVNLGWEEVHLVEEMGARLPKTLPVWVQKDANAGALGEYYFGAAQEYDDFVYLSVGSGLGGGVMSGGALLTGAHWNAAELGHLSLDPEGRRCACGGRGCAETIVSGPGLAALARERLLAHDEAFFNAMAEVAAEALTSEVIVKAARAGDAAARAAVEEVGRHLGIVMAACVAILNPGAIVVGGGLGLAAFDLLLPAARAEVERRTLPASYRNLEIRPSQVASSAVGAACLVWYHGKKGEEIPVSRKGGDGILDVEA